MLLLTPLEISLDPLYQDSRTQETHTPTHVILVQSIITKAVVLAVVPHTYVN